MGAYKVSVAEDLEDLERIDPSVFKVAEDIDVILKKHYPKGFGFLICCFDPTAGIEPHPLGYIHTLNNGSLFVPTRHEHGHGNEQPDWDHIIYSINTIDGNDFIHQAGISVAEVLAQYAQTVKEKPDKFELVAPVENVESINTWSSKLPDLGKITSLRKKKVNGPNDNVDLVFKMNEVSDKAEEIKEKK